MSFNIGLSGLNASAKNLDVIGHNIANVNTVGAKAQRAEFAQMYASSLGSVGGMGLGMGTSIASVSQKFTQGNLSDTRNELDLAINGAGFFTLEASNGERIYTRAGNFKLDEVGEIVANNGAKLVDPTTGEAYQWPNGGVTPGRGTTSITMELNLDTRVAIARPNITTGLTDPPLRTYSTTLQVFDQQGDAINMDFYFKKTEANTWAVYAKYPEGVGNAAAPAFVPTVGGQFNNAWNAISPDQYDSSIDADVAPDLKPIAYLQFNSFGLLNKVSADSAFYFNEIPFPSATPAPILSASGQQVNGLPGTETWFDFAGNGAVGSTGNLAIDVITGIDTDFGGLNEVVESQRMVYPNATLISGPSGLPVPPVKIDSFSSDGDGIYTLTQGGNSWKFSLPGGWGPGGFSSSNFQVSVDNIKNASGATDSLGQLNSPLGITVDFSKVTQNAQEFSVTALDQDGNPPGFLTKISVEDDGTISAKYTNGQTESMGQLKLANFRNVSGLQPSSGGYWVETKDSGGPVFGAPGSGSFGTLQSGGLEESNVDLTTELVSMMGMQRNYQANSQTIKTQSQIMNTLINLR